MEEINNGFEMQEGANGQSDGKDLQGNGEGNRSEKNYQNGQSKVTADMPDTHGNGDGDRSENNQNSEVTVDIRDNQSRNVDDRKEQDEKYLKELLWLYFNLPFELKMREGKWKFIFNLLHCFLILVQAIKVGVITNQVGTIYLDATHRVDVVDISTKIFQKESVSLIFDIGTLYLDATYRYELMLHFGNDRGTFSSFVNRGHLVLQHLFLEQWHSGLETLQYPNPNGEFAVYTINDLESAINFAVKNYYNAERDAIGFYIRTEDDSMTATIKFYDFPSFHSSNVVEDIIISDIRFPIDKGLTAEVVDGNETVYSYNVTRELDHYNISQPIKRMFATTLEFNLHSVRSHEVQRKATCLRTEGRLEFKDNDNNGQVLVGLSSKSSRILCKDMNLSISDWQLVETTSEHARFSVILMCFMSLLLTFAHIVFVFFTCVKTKQFMRYHHKKDDLPTSEYCRFFKLWDFAIVISDILTLNGTFWIMSYNMYKELELEALEHYVVWLGIGCTLAWICLLRFFKFSKKFHLLFSTIYRAFWDVFAYLVCVSFMFVGFWLCGYVVMAPYHVKFQTPAIAAETLFSLASGDEIFATLALADINKSMGNWAWWFSRLYIGAFVAIFTIVGVNLLISLFLSASKTFRGKKYEHEEGHFSMMEKAVRRVVDENGKFKKEICEIMRYSEAQSVDKKLQEELSRCVRLTEDEIDVELQKPKKLTALMVGENDENRPFNLLKWERVEVYWG